MTTTLIVIAVTLCILAYTTKRKYGLPVLALVGGSIISTYWSSYIATTLKEAGIVLVSPPLVVVVAVGLILLPCVIMLTVGPKYHKKHQHILSAVFIGFVATVLTVTTVTNVSPELIQGDTLAQQIKVLQPIIIVIAIIAGIADSFVHHLPSKSKKSLH
jgi:hypothetical protein